LKRGTAGRSYCFKEPPRLTPLAGPAQHERARIRVHSGGLVAECRRCEAALFVATGDPAVLACDCCAAEVNRAALVEQIRTAARLVAEVTVSPAMAD
jgi:hypothetical protein